MIRVVLLCAALAGCAQPAPVVPVARVQQRTQTPLEKLVADYSAARADSLWLVGMPDTPAATVRQVQALVDRARALVARVELLGANAGSGDFAKARGAVAAVRAFVAGSLR